MTAPILTTDTGLSVLAVSGADSRKFLQGQTTPDFRELSAELSRLGGACNLKGRLLFSFRAVQHDAETFWLVLDSSLLELARQTLQKYIVFSKATLSTPAVQVYGLHGLGAAALLAEQRSCPAQTDAVTAIEGGHVICLHGSERYLLLQENATLPAALLAQTQAGQRTDWLLAEITGGEPRLTQASSELFQPQELNLPSLQGVSYNKGCYTGQEVVARLYFRGKLKQWLHRFRVRSHEVPAVNAGLLDGNGQTQGHVVQAVATPDGTVELLAVVRHEHASVLTLAGQPLHLLELPYTVEVRD